MSKIRTLTLIVILSVVFFIDSFVFAADHAEDCPVRTELTQNIRIK